MTIPLRFRWGIIMTIEYSWYTQNKMLEYNFIHKKTIIYFYVSCCMVMVCPVMWVADFRPHSALSASRACSFGYF